MPAYAEVAGATAIADMTALPVVATPTQGGSANFGYAEVLEVNGSAGIVPGKAVISIRNTNLTDETTPITLDDQEGIDIRILKFWSRVNITQNGITVFTGALMKRRDSISGNSVILEYWDDRWLLQGIPLRGCITYDVYSTTMKFIPRLMPHSNPGGYKNCTRLPNTDNYVFIFPPELGTKTVEYDPLSGTSDEVAGTAMYWTPERWLKYLNYYSTTFSSPTGDNGLAGTPYAGSFATLDTSKLSWPRFTFQAGGMQGKMPDMDFKGMTVLGALKRTFDITGQYDFHVDYAGGYLKAFTTAKGVLNSNTSTAGKSINLLRGGSALDVKSVVDGVAESDASQFKPAALTEGAPYKIESEFRYTKTQLAGDSLTPAWTDIEQQGFLLIISSGKQLLPKLDGNGGISSYVADTIDIPGGDGSGNLKNTIQAVQVARSCFPRPFRAFQVDPAGPGLSAIMAGINLGAYPYLGYGRVALPEQLQSYFETTTAQRGRMRIPIRIQVSDVDVDTASPKFHDTTYNNGLRITNDGLIWLDGLTDDLASLDSIYTNTLRGYTGTVGTLPKVRYIKINMAVEHDARLFSQTDLFANGADPNNIGDQIDASLTGTQGPFLQHYVLSHEGFINEQQVTSSPVLSNSFLAFNGTVSSSGQPSVSAVTTPTTGVIYNNAATLSAHTQRVQSDMCRIRRCSTFEFLGIHLDLQTGDFIDKVIFQGAATTGEYKVNAPIVSLKFDFKNQKTTIRME